MTRPLIALLAICLLGAAACGSDDDGSASSGPTVTGAVTAPADPASLPDDAVVTVRIEDISVADGPAVVVAEQTITVADGDFPVDFELSYDTADIDERNTYRVSARVEADGTLLMISDTVIPVITNEAPTEGVTVGLVNV